MVANKMAEHLDPADWRIIIVDRDENHYYQPGFLFIPFGIYSQNDVVKPKRNFLPPNVEIVFSDIEVIEPDQNRVTLARENRVIHYDYLVIATGSHLHPEETPGMVDGGWRKNIFDFYSVDGAAALARHLKFWKGGRLVLNIVEMPIKCPVAPLEFLFLADWFFHERGIRDKVDLVFATPLPGAFTKPRASSILGDMLEQKHIDTVPEFMIMEVDASKNVIRSYDEQEVEYDLLVTIPLNMGSDVIQRSGMGDELNFVHVDKNTMQSSKWENIFLIGDASNAPTSKAGSVAHFMLDVVVDNILRHMEGLPLLPKFDGHANCFIEFGFREGHPDRFQLRCRAVAGQVPAAWFWSLLIAERVSRQPLGQDDVPLGLLECAPQRWRDAVRIPDEHGRQVGLGGGMENELAQLNQKIDALTTIVTAQQQRLMELEGNGNGHIHEKLDYLVVKMEDYWRRQGEFEELKNDLIPVANHMIKLSIDELAEIGSEFQLEDLLFLVKRLLRDTHLLVDLLTRVESMADLFDEIVPIGNQAFNQGVELLDHLERQGYFTFARAGWNIVERIVSEFSEDDVNALGDNIVLILNTIKEMTQPEIMNFVRNTLLIAEKEVDKPVDTSYLGLLRQMQDPSVRRGLALTMRVLHVVGAQAEGNGVDSPN